MLTDRPNLLFVSQCLPYPPHSGVTNRTYHIVTALQVAFDVTLVAFSRQRHQSDADARAASAAALRGQLSDVLPPEPIPSQQSRLRKVWDHTRSVLSGRPYVYFEYQSRRIESQIADVVAHARPALVHFDSMDLYRYLPAVEGIPATCTHHSIESDLLRLRAERINYPMLAAYLRYQAALVERAERRWTPEFSANLMMSDMDAERLTRLAPNARTLVVPNGVDTGALQPHGTISPIPGRVVFLGPTYMFPNRDAVNYFLADIWPTVRRRKGGTTFHMIGRLEPGDRERYEGLEGVTCSGFVPDLRPPMAEAECCVVPIRVGGGTRLKILDAWALGKAVVSTSIGCEGLRTVDGENILVRDTPESFAKAVEDVLCDARLRTRLEAGGRRTVETEYDWRIIGVNLRREYLRLMGG